MKKKRLLEQILNRLREELATFEQAARSAHAEATHEQNRADNKYDTRGLEASYLARGQSRQVAEIEAAILEFQKLPQAEVAEGSPIEVGCYVELKSGRETRCYFIGPKAGGTEVIHAKKEVLVITPQSPIGGQLMGRREGETITLVLGGSSSSNQILLVR